MRNLMIWNVVVAAVLGGTYGAVLHLLLGKGGAARTALKTIGIVLLTGVTTPYVAPALRSVAAPIFPKSRVEQAVDNFEARLGAMPEWQERTRGRSRSEVSDIAYELGFKGVRRLDDDSLATAVNLVAALLGDLDVHTCAGLVKGTAPRGRVSTAFVRNLDKADAATLDAWMDLLYAAASAELKGRQPAAPTNRDVAGAIQQLIAQMPRQDAELLRATLLGIKTADDEHACWAARTMYYYLPRLPDGARRDLTRALFAS